jgi:hypothetical protein
MNPFIRYVLRVVLGTIGFAAMFRMTQIPDVPKNHPVIYFLGMLVFGVPTLLCGACSAASWSICSAELGWVGGALVFATYFAILLLPGWAAQRSGKAAWKWLQRILLSAHLLVGLGLATYVLWF